MRYGHTWKAGSSMANFTPCKSLPDNLYPWWVQRAYGGNSICIQGYPALFKGCTLPNCVGWAWGRYQQIRGSVDPRLPASNAGNWFRQAQNAGMNTGSEPALGAVACFNGHVAIVEEIAADGSFINCSESDYGGAAFTYRTRYRSQNWSFPGYARFMGFIYNENVEPGPEPGPDPEPQPPSPDPDNPQKFKWWFFRRLMMQRYRRD